VLPPDQDQPVSITQPLAKNIIKEKTLNAYSYINLLQPSLLIRFPSSQDSDGNLRPSPQTTYHEDAPAALSIPVPHGVHDDAPALEYVSATQVNQLDWVPSVYVPALHCVHEADPGAATSPEDQAVQVLDSFTEYVPAPQFVQLPEPALE